MTEILLSGCNGKMGLAITKCVNESYDNCEIAAGIDCVCIQNSVYPVFSEFSEFKNHADVIIDFSSPSVLDSLLTYALNNKTPIVICTTGLNSEQVQKLKIASKTIPVFYSRNMSLGVNLIIDLAKSATQVLGDNFDIEIIEKHHNQKVDAPSGTALMLAEEINSALDDKMSFEFDRHSKIAKRSKSEIGLHSVRGGNIVGEHEVIFAGHDEIISIKHTATSKDVFAVGAINAAIYISKKENGLYDMKDLIKNN